MSGFATGNTLEIMGVLNFALFNSGLRPKAARLVPNQRGTWVGK